jgi:cytochrome b6-f complex iron-sulfur subunit
MKRREFIKNSCLGCMAIASGILILDSCTSTKVTEVRGDIFLLKSAFTKHRNVVIESTVTQHKIIVEKKSEDEYIALPLVCTHKGADLILRDDLLVCPAHGSIFDLNGTVLSAPANTSLRPYYVSVKEDSVVIHVV